MPRSGQPARPLSGAQSRRNRARRKNGKSQRPSDYSDVRRRAAVALSEGQTRVLELIATGAPLASTLDCLAQLIEASSPGVQASVLLLDADGVTLRHGAAPSLPEAYSRAVDGKQIGPRMGSCGTAAYRNESVVVGDIARDPLWRDYREVAALYGLRACWSTPIRDAGGRVLGTFAMYMRRPGRPSARHMKLIGMATHTAAIAIIRERNERERAQLVRDLDERVKELTVLHRASRLLQAGRPVDRELLSELALLLPAGWQHSEVCEARITYGGVEAKTPGWRKTPWVQSTPIVTGDGREGSIDIAYVEERPAATDGPFSAEERRLARSLADMLVTQLERARVEAALRESEAVFRSIFESAAIGITMVDMQERIVRCNRAFTQMLGYAGDELIGRTFSEFTHPDDIDANRNLYRAMRDGGLDHFDLEKRYRHKDGGVIWARIHVSLVSLRGSDSRFTIGMVEDITTQKAAEGRIRHLAYYDPLTALPNRASLQAGLAQAVEKAKESGRPLALLLMNINGFRDINTTLGHDNGDELLRQVAVALRDALWESDLVACLGGDEYAILIARMASRSDIDLVVTKIAGAIKRPVNVAGIPVNVDASIGIALYPDHGENPQLLWQHADVALRAAREKQQGHILYAPEVDHHDPRRLALLGQLTDAIDRNELTLHYQPKIDLRTERAIAVEALVRWNHPAHGLIYPDRFVPTAERTHLIDPLTTWVLANALRQGQLWHAAGLPLQLSVNLSARNLHNPNLVAEILDLARSSRFPLDHLTVEITESAIMADPALAKSVLTELRESGIVFSMDDFGIGQSSLAYLKDLPISKMKIDKSFVMNYREPRNAAIVRSAIELGHNLGLQVTAEGVEDEHALRELQKLGCDIAQGYHFAKPMPVDAVTSWLKESSWKIDAPASHSS